MYSRPTAYVLDTHELTSVDYLRSIGVLYWKLDPNHYENELSEIRKERGYTYSDIVIVDPQHLPNYEEKKEVF